MDAKITLDDLVNMDACGPARDAFAAQFPDGASYRELLLALAEHPQGVDWWHWLAPRVRALSPAGDAYGAGIQTLWDALEASGETFWDAFEAGGETFWDAYKAGTQTYSDAYKAGWKALLCDIVDRFFPAKEA